MPAADPVAWNFYNDGEKVNETPTDAPQFTYEGLASETVYPNLTATAIDDLGRESDHSAPLGEEFAVTLPGFIEPDDPPLSTEDVSAVDAIVAAAMAAFPPRPGVSVVITGPRGYYSKAYGSAGSRALTTDDHFRMGSCTKSFTTTRVLMEIDAGNLSLTDKLEDYVPGVARGDEIEIRHLLTMRSGVLDYTVSYQMSFVFNQQTAVSYADILNRIKASASQFAPGAGYQYSNSNTVLLGAVLEAITGESIETILHDDVISAKGLTETSWPTSTALPAPYASGYGVNPMRSIPIIGLLFPAYANQTSFNVPQLFRAAGALATTMGDLHMWGQELRDGTLLTPEMHAAREVIGEELAAAYTGEGPDFFYYGWGVYRIGSWIGHDGSVPGYSSCTMYLPGNGAVITVMENFQTANLDALTRIWYRIAEYLYPISANEEHYAEGGPFEGGMAASVGPASASASGGLARLFALPATFPATFELQN